MWYPESITAHCRGSRMRAQIQSGSPYGAEKTREMTHRFLGIPDACAFGIPDVKWGRVVTAQTALAGMVADVDLRQHCDARPAGYQVL